MQSLFHQLVRASLWKCKLEILSEIGDSRIGRRMPHLQTLFVSSRHKKGQTIMMRVLDRQEDKVPKCMAQPLTGIRKIVEFVMQFSCKPLVEICTKVANQRFLVRKVAIHGHLRAACLLRNAADGDALIAEFSKQAACRLEKPSPQFISSLEFSGIFLLDSFDNGSTLDLTGQLFSP
jgi:hypothetical protein